MSSAGFQLVAGRIPGERIATTSTTSDSSTFTTTEAEVLSVTAALVDGRTYRVRAHCRWASSVAGDRVIGRIRQDSVTGSEVTSANVIADTTATNGWPMMIEAEYTATATGDKTFVVGGVRASGTGNCYMVAASNRPGYLYVDYIRG